jgi:hypothetical protein
MIAPLLLFRAAEVGATGMVLALPGIMVARKHAQGAGDTEPTTTGKAPGVKIN